MNRQNNNREPPISHSRVQALPETTTFYLLSVTMTMVLLQIIKTYFLTWCVQLTICEPPDTRPNVLMIAVDDLRPELGCFLGPDFPSSTHPKIYSPNIDALAARSLLLKRAYVQQAVCSPSRTSLLTGRRPDTTHVTGNSDYFRLVAGNFTTLPQYFKQHGYRSIGMGKIFHPGKDASDFDDPPSWTDPYYHAPYDDYWSSKNYSYRAVPAEVREKRPLSDESIADHAIKTLQKVAPASKAGIQPFFMAVGFHKPHLPFIFPEEYLQYYPIQNISLPKNPYAPVNMPSAAWSNYEELRAYHDVAKLHASGAINTTLPDFKVLQLRQGYYTAMTYMDNMVGTVLKALQTEGLAGNTIVALWGDHGWQLGEHGEWCKHTNFEIAAHAPMMLHIPGKTDRGIITESFTEHVDLYPTLVEAAGLGPLPLCPQDSQNISACTEGTSFLPLIKNITNNQTWKVGAFSQFPRGSLMGYSLRTSRYRYTEWVKYAGKPKYKPIWSENHGTELYDHQVDPDENYNFANSSAYSKTVVYLQKMLHDGWRPLIPRSYE